MEKSIEERLKEILGEEEKKNDSDFWLFGLLSLMLLAPSLPKEQPIINIYLGSGKDV